MKLILPGGAGLVGQNLVIDLKRRGLKNIVVLDKHLHNLEVLRHFHPDITIECADLAEAGNWERHFDHADAVVMLQSQIGGTDSDAFIRNNITSTQHVLDAMRHYHVPYVVHVGSSVTESKADDDYVRTKTEQEKLVRESGLPCVILRPTLMFGWFDRKHLGWLARFMQQTPIFPIPGDGRYMRQPLYAGDFCAIVARCIERHITGKTYNITGLERIDYVDIIREIKHVTRARCLILPIPYGIFLGLLHALSLVLKDPPFTPAQLKALVVKDEFEVIDWPGIFGVTPTPFKEALEKTFLDPLYSHAEVKF